MAMSRHRAPQDDMLGNIDLAVFHLICSKLVSEAQ